MRRDQLAVSLSLMAEVEGDRKTGKKSARRVREREKERDEEMHFSCRFQNDGAPVQKGDPFQRESTGAGKEAFMVIRL